MVREDGEPVRLLHEVSEIRGDGKVESAVRFDNRTKERVTMECDAVLTFLGFKPDLRPSRRGVSC